MTEGLDQTLARAEQGGGGVAQAPTGERYELTGTIGEGGMGRVYSAVDRQFGRSIALKEISVKDPGPVAVKRFVREAVVTGNLEHPGVPAVYERGAREGRPFYAMRRIEGATLAEAIERCQTLEDRLRLLPVLVQVAHTLGYAHERGVVHRDLKPNNVVLGKHGQTTVLDWGIAKVRGAIDSAAPDELVGESAGAIGATVDGSVLGTPAYMAPEQARGQVERIDARTDVFALGATLYHVLSGRPPYDGSNASEVLAKATAKKHPPLAEVAPSVPQALRDICERAMEAEPEARHPTAAHLAEALEAAQSQALIGEGGSRWSTVLLGGVAVVVVMLVLLGSITLFQKMAPFAALGGGGYAGVAFAVLGLLMVSIEVVTRGRHRLFGPGLALAALCFLSGIAATTTGLTITLTAAQDPAVLADAEKFRTLLAWGTFESIGNLSLMTWACAVQLLAWVFARRWVESRVRTAPGLRTAAETRSRGA